MAALAWERPWTIQSESRPARRTLASMRDASDDALAAGFAAHERWAFDEAYRRYSGLLYSAARNVLENAEDAADCVHDALARVWRSRDAYERARGAVRSFLLVCVRNEAISRRRAQGRRERLAQRLAREPQEHDRLGSDDPIERDRLRAAMDRLPLEQRLPLQLAYYEGKTHVEIAGELGQPLGTIKSRIAGGLRKLAAALGPP
ncbi:MAG: sigma-70 family RNA polymerase sigma factor [Candidatus Eremiobacteraeota bacterium]|nr:sigma-70 family RNA polymerase sigma factor [Candidatus Eremiobacteraeota bacterium]